MPNTARPDISLAPGRIAAPANEKRAADEHEAGAGDRDDPERRVHAAGTRRRESQADRERIGARGDEREADEERLAARQRRLRRRSARVHFACAASSA